MRSDAMRAVFRQRVFPTTLALLALAALFAVLLAAPVLAAGPRALPEGKVPHDRRLQPLKDLNGYFPFTPPKTAAAWEQRSELVRRRMLVALGLWPMPQKTPLHAVVHGKISRADYTVERAYFESLPGFYVTGSLYRPVGKTGPRPGVLCPHGHWNEGRFTDAGEKATRLAITQGAERFEDGGRSPLQSRCVQLARMGCVVFHYDMIGYADNQQISLQIGHRFAKQRPEMNQLENWGLFSTQAETHLQSVMGLQTYNSIRALDFLESLPDVDPARLAVTGASGGGTQTLLVSAVDPRVAVSMPAVMTSTAMQGGCPCENCSLLRIDTGNVEIAALFAPKPLGLTSANDWTKELATKGYPELQQLFKMLGVADNVSLASLTYFGHNYNYVSRARMYAWFNKHLQLGLPEPIVEEGFKRLTRQEMTVWNSEHPQPEGGAAFERKLLRWLTDDTRDHLAKLQPNDKKSGVAYRAFVGGGVDGLIGRGLPNQTDLEYERTGKTDRGDYLEIVALLRTVSAGEELPLAFLHPKKRNGQVVIWLDSAGKASLYQDDGALNPQVARLLRAGCSVVGVDLLYQGEFLADGKPITTTRRVKNPREVAAYTFGYNHSLFAHRVHDVLSVLRFVRSHEEAPKAIHLVGWGDTAPIAAAAHAQAPGLVDRLAVDTSGFRFGKLLDIHSPQFLPGGAKYDDLPGMLALGAPTKLWLAGEGQQVPPPVAAAYRAANAADNVSLFTGDAQAAPGALTTWLLE